MILSNIEIQKAIDEGRLTITPDPQPRSPEYPNCPYDTTAVNVHLSSALAIPQPGPYTFDLRRGGIAGFLARNSKQITIGEEGYALKPGQFTLGNTVERITLRTIDSRSRHGRSRRQPKSISGSNNSRRNAQKMNQPKEATVGVTYSVLSFSCFHMRVFEEAFHHGRNLKLHFIGIL